jgi:hypothetical protein
VKAEVFHVDRWKDRRTDMTKLIFAFRNFANVPNHQIFIAEMVLKISASINTVCFLPGCDTIQAGKLLPTTSMNMLPPLSGLNTEQYILPKVKNHLQVVRCDKPQGTATPPSYLSRRSFLLCFIQWYFNIYSTYCKWNKNTKWGIEGIDIS